MKQSATFKIETSFNLTRLGVTAYGRLIEGKILPGYFTAIDIKGQQAKTKIKALGMGRRDESGNMKWGLTLEFEVAELENIAKADRTREQTIIVDHSRSEGVKGCEFYPSA